MKFLKRFLVLALLLMLSLGGTVWYQITSIESASISLTVQSAVLEESRPIRVYLPSDYDKASGKQYPVLYTVDGERIRNSALAFLTGKMVSDRDFILVAVDMIGKRNRDLRREGAQAFNTDTSGQAGKFLDFIETELIPEIESEFRTTPERILAGHSYGGMFTVHTMSLRPHLFEGYLAFSPALNADNRSLKDLEKFLNSDIAAGKSLYMNLGWETLHEYDVRFEQARSLIQTEMPDGFRFESNRYWLIHGAVPIPGYLEGLSFYFSEGPGTFKTSN